MEDDEKILELDYSSKNKNFFKASLTYFSLILFLVLLSSYKNPTTRLNNKLVISSSTQVSNLIKSHINSLTNRSIDDSIANINNQINTLLIEFYTNRNFQPAWLEHFNTNHHFVSLLNILDSSAYYGFPYDYFNTERIHQLDYEIKNSINKNDFFKQRIELEIIASYSALKFMIYLQHGIIEADSSAISLSNIETLPKILDNALNQTNIKNQLMAVQPDLVQHKNLLKSLSYFIDLHYSVKYTTPAFIDDKLLAKSLYYTGISETPFFDSTNFKSEALKKLADEYHLPYDSILNIPTHKSLVELLEYRYFQTCLNLNRLRNLQHSGENYLFVNIPEFKLHVIESNEAKETFNVIVGTKRTPTPTLTSNIEKVIANPYWTVPRSIVNNEMLGKIRKDSTYLARNGYFIINNSEEKVDESIINWNDNDPLGKKYWIRQNNNKWNALGQVKFIFPNNYSVYLHDTQAKKLFKKENRTFSHGCIRLENPNELAQYLTDNFNLQSKNINNLISEKQRHIIDLSEKVKIHIQYITCSGTKDNTDMIFFNDVYNKDKEDIKAIFPNQIVI